MSPTSQVYELVEQLGHLLQKKHFSLVTAESCTGGQLAQTITIMPGSSQWFDRGFVTYSKLSKKEMLGVSTTTLEQHGPVSKETVKEMAKGALKNSNADISIAITGIAGPGGGSKETPIGTVYFAWQHKTLFNEVALHHFTGDRLIIRYEAVEFALKKLEQLLQRFL